MTVQVPYYCPLPQWLAPLQRGFALIGAVRDVAFSQVNSPNPSVSRLLISEDSLPAGITGSTSLSWPGPSYVPQWQVGIAFAISGVNWTDPLREAVAIHETGHALGLQHVTAAEDSASIMIPGSYNSTPSAGDIARLASLGWQASEVQPMPDQMVLTLNGVTKRYLLTEQTSEESPDGTRILWPTTATITDRSQAVWSLDSPDVPGGHVILRNGQSAGGGAGVEIAIKNGLIYTRNSLQNWYLWNGASWGITANPF